MRPLLLTISAFGSYADKTEINLESLGQEGLYLITGTTGAGKTTIFDAIVYALYGEASSTNDGRRDPKMFRSLYADPDTETYVELKFSNGGKVYEIRRNPEYQRPKKRASKKGGALTTTEKAAVELRIPGQEPVSKKEDADRIIREEILGVTRDQFAQIAMIAQGEFRKLLQSRTTDRQAIFRSLFHTGLFNTLEDRLNQETNQASTELAAVKHAIEEQYRQVHPILLPSADELDEHSAKDLSGQWMDLVDGYDAADTIQEAIHFLDELISQEAYQSKALHQKLDEVGQRLTQAEVKMKAILDRELKEKQILETEKQLTSQQELCEIQKSITEEAEAKQPEIEALKAEAALIREQLPEYDLLDLAKKNLDQNQNDWNNKKIDLDRKQKLRERSEQELQEWEQESLKLANAGEAVQKLQNERKETQYSLDDFQKLMELFNSWKKTLILAEEAEKRLLSLKQQAELAEAELLKDKQRSADLDGTEIRLSECETSLSQVVEREKKLNQLVQDYNQLAISMRDMKEMGDQYQSFYRDYMTKKIAYDELHQRYFLSQAGLLAQELLEGSPCPVCGSLHHPEPAQLSSDAVTKEAMEEAKKAMERADDEQNKWSEKFQTQKGKADEAQKQLQNRAGEVLGITDLTNLKSVILRERKKLQEEKDGLETEQKQLQKRKDERKTLLEVTIPDAEKNLKIRQERLKDQLEAQSGIRKEEETKAEFLKQSADQLLTDWAADTLRDMAEAQMRTLRELQTRLDHEIDAAKQRQLRKKELDQTQIPEGKKALEKLKIQIDQLLSETAGLEGSILEQKKQLEIQHKTLRYTSRKEAELQSIGILKKAEGLDATIRAARESHEEAEKILHAVQGKLAQQKSDLETLAVYDKAQVLQEKLEANRLKSEGEDESRRLNTALQVNQGVLTRLLDKPEMLAAASEKYRNLKELSDLANGKLAGKGKIKLETFAQTEYLDHIVRRANYRLNEMSGGQYTLKRYESSDNLSEKLAGDHTLDLNVIDHHNDTIRSVNTLSGGEAFLASLALALGLSDEIAASASNVQMETLFVDEGFGSLDEDTLQMAIRTLQHLTEGGRLVGIISHVADLKNRIDNQVIVSKDHDGKSSVNIRLG